MEKVVRRYFTEGKLEDGQSVYDLFDWKNVDVEIRNQKTDEIIFSQTDCEFPAHYSQTACEIIASKYFFRAVPETSLKQVVDRMAKFWIKHLERENLLHNKEESEIFYDEIVYSLLCQLWAPNSPQWFNTGIAQAYGIKGDPDNLFYYDELLGETIQSPDRYTRTQASACFILDIKDQLLGEGSITDHYVNETKLFKGGSGVGTNFSPLRAEGEHLSSGGTSSGLMSYLEGLDRNAGAIKSGGTTRRAAKMVIVDIDHPEIEAFIDWKAHEEKKAKALIEAGYDGSIGGEAYNTVSGQNSNNSVRLNKEFISLLSDPEAEYKLNGRIDPCVDKVVKAKELWDKIAEAAWECGDPAVQFDDIYNEWNTCSNSGRINATNPCSEFAFLDNSACNLASIDVFKFYDQERQEFDVTGYTHLIGLVQMVLEASIAGGQFPTKEVAENSYLFRPTGLGMANIASLFLALGLPYDSQPAREWAGALASLMTGWSYVVSSGMAMEVGPFSEWSENKEPMARVIRKHRHYTQFLVLEDPRANGLMDEAKKVWNTLDAKAVETGFRNAQVTVMAPTGTISLAMDCGATGIEPFYSHTTYKKCADGSYIEIENPLYNPELPKAVLATAGEISPEGHVKMMAAIQPFISGSISKTVNLPEEATPEDIKNIYLTAYKLGCKSIAIYRDGSKGIQPLSKKDEEKDEKDEIVINEPLRPRKPEGIRNSRTHSAKLGDVELYITIGYYPDGDMAELFVSTDRDGTVVKGLLTCLSKAISHLLQNGVRPQEISKMLRNQKFEPSGIVSRHPNIKFAESIADLISKVIDVECGDYKRCEVKGELLPVEIALEDNISPTLTTVLQGLETLKSLNDTAVSPTRELSEAVEEFERLYGECCPNCGSDILVKSGSCKTCLVCGSTTGCS